MQYQYAEATLGEAIDWMAWHPGDVRARLQDVYMVLIALKDVDWPEELLPRWRALEARLTAKGPITAPGTDRVIVGATKNTLRRMRNTTASGIAQELIAISKRVKAINADAQIGSRADVPAFGGAAPLT